MSTRQHECPNCGATWHCEGCETREVEKQDRGVIACPVCKGELYYSVAKSNGHIWGNCQSTNCLKWMQ